MERREDDFYSMENVVSQAGKDLEKPPSLVEDLCRFRDDMTITSRRIIQSVQQEFPSIPTYVKCSLGLIIMGSLEFNAPAFPGDVITLKTQRRDEAVTLNSGYNCIVEGINETTRSVDGKPANLVQNFRMKTIPAWQARSYGIVRGEDNIRYFPISKSNTEIVVCTDQDQFIPYGEIPPVPEFKQGYRFGRSVKVTESMIEGIQYSLGREEALVDVIPPYSVSAVLGRLGGKDGSWTIIFLGFTTKLATGYECLRKGNIFETRLQVLSNRVKLDDQKRPLRSILQVGYEVCNGRRGLISQGTAIVLAEPWPYKVA